MYPVIDGLPTFPPTSFLTKRSEQSWSEVYKKCIFDQQFLTNNFGQKYPGQKCTKTAFMTKFSGQKWPKLLATTVVSKCCGKF